MRADAVRLGDSANDGATGFGRPLDGVRILSLEQMQALPFATQMLARLGADVIKVEQVGRGDAGRAAAPAITRENGERIGATFLRNNLNKRSIAIDLKSDRGRQLVIELAAHVDIVCENLGPGRAKKFGLDYDSLSPDLPAMIYLSISGFGSDGRSPYDAWPAYASVAEALSGIYEYSRLPHQPPVLSPSGGLGDTGTGLFAIIGILAALRHRETTGLGQNVDVAMLDAMLSLADVSYNFWSMGLTREPDAPINLPLVMTSFRAHDGWFMLQVGRDHQFTRLAQVVGHPEWTDDPRLATREGWTGNFDELVRPDVEAWASGRSAFEAARALAEAGLAAAPCSHASDVVADPHAAQRNMLVEIPRTDGIDQPVLVAGNPIKLSNVPEGPDRNVPLLGEHTTSVLAEFLGLDDAAITDLEAEGVVAVAHLSHEAGG